MDIIGNEKIAKQYLSGAYNFKEEKISNIEVMLLTKICDVRKWQRKIVVVGDMSKGKDYCSILGEYKYNLIDRDNGVILLTDCIEDIPRVIEKSITKQIKLLDDEIMIEIELNHEMAIDYTDMQKKPMYIISIVGKYKGRAGQCRQYIEDNKDKMNCIDKIIWDKINTIWKNYHMNNFKAGTKQQTEIIEECKDFCKDYNEEVQFLKAHGLYEDMGYRYGRGWLCQELPNWIVNLIKEI